jgi:6-phosphogluconolactonase
MSLVGCGGHQSNGSAGGANGPTPGEYLWEFSLTDNNLYVATINESNGQLGTPVTSGGTACNSSGTIPSIAVSPSNKFVFVIDKCLASIHVYAMSGPGVVLTEIPQSPYYVSNDLDSIAIDPAGKFLYAVGTNPSAIFQVSVNGGTGELTSTSTTMITGDIRQVVTDPQGKFVFVNDLTDGKIFAFSVSSGSVSPVAGSPFTVPAGGMPVNLLTTGNGNFLYAPLIPSGIAAFAVNNGTGALSSVAGSPFSTTNQPFSFAIGGGGQFLYSVGGSSYAAIEGFSISGSGALTPLPGLPLPTPSSLSSIAAAASGNFLYATVQTATLSNSMILGFAIDSSTGSLTPLTTSPYSAAPFPIDAVSLKIP